MRSKTLLEFLPAALEIQETPPSLGARLILWAIMGFLAAAVVWACVSEVDVVAVAQGKTVPGSRVKIIQPLEAGTVRRILVREGDRVAEGQALVELDDTAVSADREQLRSQQLSLELERRVIAALLEGLQESGFRHRRPGMEEPPDFQAPEGATRRQADVARERFEWRLREYDAQAAALAAEHEQMAAEREAVRQQIQRLDSTIPLATERAASVNILVDRNLAPRGQWLDVEQERIGLVKERDVQRQSMQGLDAAIRGIGQRQAALRAELEGRLNGELAAVEDRLAALSQERIKVEKRIAVRTLSAPVAGKVHRLAVHTVGGVVTPAQELMRIVPEQDAVEIEAWVANKDIGFVYEGQSAEIKVEAFPFTRFGTLGGEIAVLSMDAVADEQLGLVYPARLQLNRGGMRVGDRLIELRPGMAVTVEVKLGQRRLIEFLLSPLLRYKNESLREL